MTLLMETGGDDGILTEQGTIVMDCQETDVTPKAEKWAKHVLGLLDRFTITISISSYFSKICQPI